MSNYDGFKKFQAHNKKKHKKSKFDYKVKDGKIIIANKSFTLKKLYILSYLIEFLSLDLCIMGLIRIFYYSSMGGIPYVLLGVFTFFIGLNYRKVATEVKDYNRALADKSENQSA